jgi:hypothetical protein
MSSRQKVLSFRFDVMRSQFFGSQNIGDCLGLGDLGVKLTDIQAGIINVLAEGRPLISPIGSVG